MFPQEIKTEKTDLNDLFLALRENNRENIKEAITNLKKGNPANIINTPDQHNKVALHYAVETGDLEVVQLLKRSFKLLKFIPWSEEGKEEGKGVLLPQHIAAQSGYLDILEFFMKTNVLDKIDKLTGNTELHFAAEKDHVSIVKFLLENGANPNIKNNRGKKPSELAKTEALITLLQTIEAPQQLLYDATCCTRINNIRLEKEKRWSIYDPNWKSFKAVIEQHLKHPDNFIQKVIKTHCQYITAQNPANQARDQLIYNLIVLGIEEAIELFLEHGIDFTLSKYKGKLSRETGHTLYVVTELPIDCRDNQAYLNSYLWIRSLAKLYYVRDNQLETVNITDSSLFTKVIISNAKESKQEITVKNISEYITKNGGHQPNKILSAVDFPKKYLGLYCAIDHLKLKIVNIFLRSEKNILHYLRPKKLLSSEEIKIKHPHWKINEEIQNLTPLEYAKVKRSNQSTSSSEREILNSIIEELEEAEEVYNSLKKPEVMGFFTLRNRLLNLNQENSRLFASKKLKKESPLEPYPEKIEQNYVYPIEQYIPKDVQEKASKDSVRIGILGEEYVFHQLIKKYEKKYKDVVMDWHSDNNGVTISANYAETEKNRSRKKVGKLEKKIIWHNKKEWEEWCESAQNDPEIEFQGSRKPYDLEITKTASLETKTLFFEVKTTTGDFNAEITLSAQEAKFMKTNADNYRMIRVYGLFSRASAKKFKDVQNLLDNPHSVHELKFTL